ncbi:MAG: peptidoglycan-binding protein [Lewinellaceae bacterium]|nr:peptidoglycan-binding protein [Saprospiraceae bacterium]MCB9317081.1 peptidoglycan-binding protein [Lewinellaceae bacterium]MCB9334246.1 peptidoglycan-binding protein [Lewinellaceae bacterium]
MATILKIGNVDENALPADRHKFLELYHAGMAPGLQSKLMFRDEATWRSFEPVPGRKIKELQLFLKKTGFMPKAAVDGVFGYATQAATRLFQEYIRSVDGQKDIGTPDGVVGPLTWSFVDAWQKDKARKKSYVCDWGSTNYRKSTPEFRKWTKLLSAAKKHFSKIKNEHPILQLVEQFDRPTDTQKVSEWDTRSKTIHLIGIRCGEDERISGTRRENNDLFVLLINGQVFKFWGSTDPSPNMADRADLPFLVESQHEYRFGWHKLSHATKIYQALRPAGPGVLVFRDKDFDRSLTTADVKRGLDPSPNTTINIHWSGIGTTNFSAGCQVIAGNAYINPDGKLIDCSHFAARNQNDLLTRRTRGAYNVFTDLILTYAPPGVQTIRYMLGRDETFQNFKGWDESFIAEDVKQLRKGGF